MAAFLPTITAPLVAKAIGTQDWESAKDRVCEGLFLSVHTITLGVYYLPDKQVSWLAFIATMIKFMRRV